MAGEKKPVILKRDHDLEEASFEDVLDTTCERLWERHIQYSIRRIREMEEELKCLEQELDEFIGPSAHGAEPVAGNRGVSHPRCVVPLRIDYE